MPARVHRKEEAGFPESYSRRRWGPRYENTERRATKVAEKGLMYMGMGVSGGEEGARNGAAYLPMPFCSWPPS